METNSEKNLIIEKVMGDPDFRIDLVRRSPFWFAHYYFQNHIEVEMAEMHKEMLDLLANNNVKLLGIAGFRNSGKSTLASEIFPIWEILGVNQIKFIVIISETQRQAEVLLDHIKKHMEQNALLIRDLGPLYEERDQWGRLAIVIKKYNAKIMAASLEQSIRGIRYCQFRPQLFIIDDIENLQSVKNADNREKLWAWYQGEILPAGSIDAKIVAVGGILHQDSFLIRLKKSIEEKGNGIFRSYPFVDSEGKIAWPARFPNQKAIDKERNKYSGRTAWEREMQLNPIQDEEAIIKPEHLCHYEQLPDFSKFQSAQTFIAIDPAVSEKETADYTAIVAVTAVWDKNNRLFYVHPNPINERLSLSEIKKKAVLTAKTIRPGHLAKIVVEDIGSQRWLIQEINKEGVRAEAFAYRSLDKETKIRILGGHMQEKRVFFPITGIEELIKQLLGFRMTRYDDLADATAMAVITASEFKLPVVPEILFFD